MEPAEAVARAMTKVRWDALNEDYKTELMGDARHLIRVLKLYGYDVLPIVDMVGKHPGLPQVSQPSK